MQSVKQKVSDTAVAAKEQVDVLKAKAGGKAGTSTATQGKQHGLLGHHHHGPGAATAAAPAMSTATQGKKHGLFGHHHHGPAAATAAAPAMSTATQGKKHGLFGHNHHGPGTATAAAPGYGHDNAMGGTVTSTNVANPTHKPFGLGGHRHNHHDHMGLK